MLRPVLPFVRWALVGLAASAALVGPSRAAADEPPTRARSAAGDDLTSYSFEDEAVLGTTARPTGEVLHVRAKRDRESLIRVREQYVRELLKSVEAL